MGFISVYELTPARASYIAQYTVKKMTQKDSHNLNGRYPEFARMSRRPGLADPVIPWLADQHLTRLGSQALLDQGDVFTAIRLDGKIWPLGQFLRSRLRKKLGVPDTAIERAQMFNKVYEPQPDDWCQPIENYSPEMDVTQVLTSGRITRDEKETQKAIPQLRQKATHSARRSARRNSQLNAV